jgi:hypothetical protein
MYGNSYRTPRPPVAAFGECLTLPLFVAGIGADDVDDAAAADDLALVANALDAGLDFHRFWLVCSGF